MIPIKVSNSKIKVRDETGEFKEVSIGSANLGTTVNINDNVDGKDSTWSSENLNKKYLPLYNKCKIHLMN